MAALKISRRELLIARIAAMKNVLSPNSDISRAEKADTKPTLKSLLLGYFYFSVELLVEL